MQSESAGKKRGEFSDDGARGFDGPQYMLRTIEARHAGVSVDINQCHGSGELGATVWDCSLALMAMFDHSPALLESCHHSLLDLSGGTGALGVFLAKLLSSSSSNNNARVTISDVPVLMPLIKHNVARNDVSCQVVPYRWADPVADFSDAPFEVIVASDLITQAYAQHFGLLVQTFKWLSDDDTIIYVGYEVRDHGDEQEKDAQFFTLLQGHFSVERMTDELDPLWSSDDIQILKLRRFRESVV